MISLVILSVLFRAASSSCPALEHSYRVATQQLREIRKNDQFLIDHGAIVQSTDIANVFFSQPPYTAEASDNFNRTTTLLLAEQTFCSGITDVNKVSRTLNQHTPCVPLNLRCSTMPIESCPKDHRYRTITGACNNVKHPKWGKSYTPYGRILSANFADGIHEVRKSVVKQQELPGARLVTNAINKNPFTCAPKFFANYGSVMYGQLMAHDHGMRQMFQTKDGGYTRSCCNKDYTKPLSKQPYDCHAFQYTKDDPYLAQISPNCSIQCQNYIRSQVIFPNDCSLGAATPVNLVTQYLDLSPVYGSEKSVADALRSFKDGKLRTNANNVLPETCNDPNVECYLTGDARGTGFPTLGIQQSIYHRLHNIIATVLKLVNPKWNDERLFQEAKRINIAIYQNNVYTEWLRVFIGDDETKGFRPIKNEYLGKYSETVDASSTVELSHCVFRIFHSNLNDELNLVDAQNKTTETLMLDELDVGLRILETKYDEFVRGLIRTGAAHESFTARVRNALFNNGNKFNLGIDLISTDLFIGRDLGLQPYHVYFKLCTGKDVKSWDDLIPTIPAEGVEDLKSVYKNVYDIDTYAAVALEAKCGSYLGTVGKCLLVKQYERTRAGDRYFYSLENGAYPFTPKQLKVIYNFTYSRVLCTTTGISEAPLRAFEIPTAANPTFPCVKGIDLSAWKDTKA